jgi:hypothetical protein
VDAERPPKKPPGRAITDGVASVFFKRSLSSSSQSHTTIECKPTKQNRRMNIESKTDRQKAVQKKEEKSSCRCTTLENGKVPITKIR